jgi:hypothetical protein
MIRLTIKSTENPIYIAPDNITAICDDKEGGAEVYSGHDFTLVRETAAEVARKVLEWRLAMERYKAAYGMDIITPNETPESYKVEGYLRRLAGLEEQNHDT